MRFSMMAADLLQALIGELREMADTGNRVEARGLTFVASPQWFADWAARIEAAATAPAAAEPVATTLSQSRWGDVEFSPDDWRKLEALPPGTALYAEPVAGREGQDAKDARRLEWLAQHFASGGGMDAHGLDHPDWPDSIEWSDAADPSSFRSLIDAALSATPE
jgi:hypothetical protein